MYFAATYACRVSSIVFAPCTRNSVSCFASSRSSKVSMKCSTCSRRHAGDPSLNITLARIPATFSRWRYSNGVSSDRFRAWYYFLSWSRPANSFRSIIADNLILCALKPPVGAVPAVATCGRLGSSNPLRCSCSPDRSRYDSTDSISTSWMYRCWEFVVRSWTAG